MGYTFKCLGSGVWGLAGTQGNRQKTDFKKLISLLALQGGDADTNAAVCGALVGCVIGYSKLPEDWLGSLTYKPWLDQKATALLKLMGLLDSMDGDK